MIAPVIVDTNIVVAGLLTSRADAPVARILDAMLAADFAFVLSTDLIAEYRDVLARPKLRALHGLDDNQRETLLVQLVQHAIIVQPPHADASAPDPGDQHLWDLLLARNDLRLVTGDKPLFNDPAMRNRLLDAAQFVATWR